MAYGNNNAQARPAYGSKGPSTAIAKGGAAPARKEFVDDPNDLGIGYEKDLKAGGKYISLTVTKDIAAGTKVLVFANDKVKNRTEKTPTHRLKLSVKRAE